MQIENISELDIVKGDDEYQKDFIIETWKYQGSKLQEAAQTNVL